MSIPTTTRAAMADHIAALNVGAGDNIVVHSRLTSFGLLEDGSEGACAAIRAVIGTRGTLAVPTFRLHASVSDVYNRLTSPSERCGQLSEFVRQLPESRRSRCPLHSYAAVGPDSSLLDQPTGRFSMGPDSDFDVLHHNGFKQVFLGAEFADAATIVVHAMACFGRIPYRTWLDLPRQVVDDEGNTRNIACRYYGRSDRSTDIEDWSVPKPILERSGKLHQQKTHFGRSYAFMMNDLITILINHLTDNPEGLLASTGAPA